MWPDPKAVKRRIGVQLQATALFDYQKLHEIIFLFGTCYGIRRPKDDCVALLDRVGLAEKADAYADQLSGGQAQRLSIALALVNDPVVTFLDEPTTGLDPRARRALWDVIREINGDGTTVVLTTHYMEEAERLCDRVAVMDLGHIRGLDMPRTLINQLGAEATISFDLSEPLPLDDLCAIDGATGCREAEEGLRGRGARRPARRHLAARAGRRARGARQASRRQGRRPRGRLPADDRPQAGRRRRRRRRGGGRRQEAPPLRSRGRPLMRTFLDFVWHDTQMTMRNKQALFWSFFFPVMLMGLLGIVFGQPNAFTAKLAIVPQDRGRRHGGRGRLQAGAGGQGQRRERRAAGAGRPQERRLRRRARPAARPRAARADRDGGRRGRQSAAAAPLEMPYYYDNSSMIQASEVNSVVQQVLQQLSYFATDTKPAFALKMQAVAAAGFDYIDFLVPGVIAMAIMTNGIYAVSGTFVTYRQKGVLHRLRATPMPLSSFIGANVVVHLVRSLIQAALVLAVGVFVFHVHVAGVHLLGRVAVMALVGAGCFVTIGFFVAAVAKNVEVAAALGQVIGTPMMFLSGIFFPMDNAPAWIQPVVKLMPLTYLANGLRDVIIHGTSLWFVRLDLAVLAVFTVVFMGLSVRYFRWE